MGQFIEVTPVGQSEEKMMIQVSYIMSIAPIINTFRDENTCKILVPGMMFEVKEAYETIKAAIIGH